MGVTSNIQNLFGVLSVQIEGFFTERFINLCRINNIKIWDIKNIVKGVIRFQINISDFKKLRKIAKKTKCKVIIKSKKGIYFTFFKYRKRKLAFIFVFLAILFSIVLSTFVWSIDVVGNENISNEEIISDLKSSGLYVGKSKIGLDKKEIINQLRSKENGLSWVGIEIDGSKVFIKVVEKTVLDQKDIQNTTNGDIIANKSGVITKIVAENGTSICKESQYIEKGNILIEGMVYNKKLESLGAVPAKGYVRVDNIYTFENDYLFDEINKEYTSKKRWTVGITINSKENMINYLNKSKKYDITKNSKGFDFFNNEISFDVYKCREYNEVMVKNTKEELEIRLKEEADKYLNNEILANCTDPILVDTAYIESDIDGGIKVKVEYVVNEQVGEFIERSN